MYNLVSLTHAKSSKPPRNFHWDAVDTSPDFENLYFTKMNISGSKTNGNNKLTNLTININSQHIQHDEVGDTWNYTKQNNLWL